MPDRIALIAVFEITLLLAGLIFLWRIVLSPATRQQWQPAVLPRWDAPVGEFFLFCWLVVSGAAIGSFAAGVFLNSVKVGPDAKIAIATGAGQFGMIAGIVIFRRFFDRHRTTPATTPSPDPTPTPNAPPTPTSSPNALRAGAVTFLISMPIMSAVALTWHGLLHILHIPAEKQDLVRMFNEADSPAFLVTMIVLACVGAPVTEELIFRGGIFRFARTRLPHWLALLVPAVLFAALHQYISTFAPLVALGIIFSLAYERTGNIKVTMVAHALFNLNSIVLIFAGTDPH